MCVAVGDRLTSPSSVNITKRGNAWQIAVELPPDPVTGKRRQRFETFHGSKKDADKRLPELLSLVDQRLIGATAKVMLGAYLDRWLADYASQKAPKTHQRYQEIVRNWLKPNVGAVRLDKLTASHVLRLQATVRDA